MIFFRTENLQLDNYFLDKLTIILQILKETSIIRRLDYK